MPLKSLRSSTFVLALAGCAGAPIADPTEAARRYADAAQRADADAIYAMMSEEARRAFSQAEVRTLVREQRAELSEQAKALRGPGVVVKAEASVRYADGEEVGLAVESDGYRISAVEALPSSARTPLQALSQLRRVLARRSYSGLIRVLSPTTRAAIEADLRSLVEGLEHPEGLELDIQGDMATVVVPGGHEVRLRREGGQWHVETFD